MSIVVLKQAFIMMCLIAVGAGCFKLKILSRQAVSEISSLVLKVVNPIIILMAYQRECKPELAANLGWTFLLTALAHLIAYAVAYLCIRKKEGRETVIERFSCIYSNCGFMGIPLAQAMFGSEGVFYITAYLTGFNVLVWSHGVMQMSGEHSLKSLGKVLRSPAIIAIAAGMIMFFTNVTLVSEPPAFVTDPGVRDFLAGAQALLCDTLNMIGSLNTPLAMIVAGATIAQTDLPVVLRKPRIFLVSLLKLLVIPVLCIVLFRFLPADKVVEMTVAAAAAAPSAAICTMMSLSYKQNATYASEIFGVTTLLSVATMPLMMMAYEWIG